MTVPVLASFIDLESAVIERLGVLDVKQGVETPALLANYLPFIRVMRVGGNDNRITDTGRIDVDVFASDRPTAKALAGDMHQILIACPHITSFGVIDDVVATLSPSEVPWSNTTIQMFAAAYTLTARRTA